MKEKKEEIREKNKTLLKVLNTEKDDNIEKEFFYRNDEGEDYLKVVRHKVGEKFGIMSYNKEKNQYEYGRNGLAYIPYKLKELIESDEKVVFITNSEQDADTLEELGFLATTAPTSSKHKWKSSYGKYIKDKYVIILEDNTDEAKEFAENTQAKTAYLAKNVAILEIADLANELNFKLKYNSDITKIRKQLQDDEKLKKILIELKSEIEEME